MRESDKPTARYDDRTDRIVITAHSSVFILSPKEAFEMIRKLQDALFDYHEKTGKKLDE